jgi:hypothetical protein
MICCRNDKSSRILKIGEASIEREFDVSEFIKLQKRVRALIKVILTKAERALLRRNKRFFISKHDGHSDTSTPDDDETVDLKPLRDAQNLETVFQESPYLKSLLNDANWNTTNKKR